MSSLIAASPWFQTAGVHSMSAAVWIRWLQRRLRNALSALGMRLACSASLKIVSGSRNTPSAGLAARITS